MTPYSKPVFHAIDHGLLCCASFLVPEAQRAEWRMEWKSELWHARRSNSTSGAVSWRTEREIANFCFGAFQDAACLRRLWWQNQARFVPLHGSAAQCIFCLSGILFVSYLISILSPGIRAERDFSSTQIRPGTILIQEEGANGDSVPTMAIDQVQIWKRGRQRYVDGFAFYRVARESATIGPHAGGTWQIAQASSNLFAVAGLTLHYMESNEEARSGMPRLILSERIWREKFGANPDIVGRVLLVGSRPARIAGIAPRSAFRAVWVMERIPSQCAIHPTWTRRRSLACSPGIMRNRIKTSAKSTSRSAVGATRTTRTLSLQSSLIIFRPMSRTLARLPAS